MSIEVRNVTKRFGVFTALDDVNLEVRPGELLALLGPSGSGKTTLLRVIAGLEAADAGAILFHGEDATRQHARDRRVGFVFQHYALFRHMSVFENVAFGLRVRPREARPPEAEVRRRVMDLLRLVQLDALAGRRPSQLSGGQRQRVALARALAVEPRTLLLDEPFGSLDAKVRRELRRWLRRLHQELRVTTVFVTHDQEEALEVADRVVVMNEGRIVQAGTPEEVYHRPASAFVYQFLGNVNLFHGRVEGGRARIGPAPAESEGGREAPLYIRPHELDLYLYPFGDACFRATVDHVNPAGPLVKVELTSEWGAPVQVELTQERFAALGIAPGDAVFVTPRQREMFWQRAR